MANFDITCPVHFPTKCKLNEAERQELQRTPAHYRVFFMYDGIAKKDYHAKSVKSFMVPPEYDVKDWSEDIFLGVKFCKICRLALASDFGIALLTPRNFNVFLEVGFMLSLSKPVLYLFHSNNGDSLEGKEPPLNVNDLPFDLGQEIVLQYENENELKKQLPVYLEKIKKKVALVSPFQKMFRESIKEKIRKISRYPLPELVIQMLIENRPLRFDDWLVLFSTNFGPKDARGNFDVIFKNTGFIDHIAKPMAMGGSSGPDDLKYIEHFFINDIFRPILEELLFTPGVAEELIGRPLWKAPE